jgi:branched-subunit amino acid aminotransferase/4-amino-4-deoxychorismate lyase
MKKYFYCNGKILDSRKPAVLINDIGLLRGYGVFDFIRTHQGKIFHFADHFRRFTRSARLLQLRVPLRQQATEKMIHKLLRKNKVREASIRLLLTGGPTADGLSYTDPTFAILIEDIYTFPQKLFTQGAKVITYPHQRLLPTSKNNNYIQAIRLAPERLRQKAVEVLFTDKDKILECSTSNFFIFKGDTLITPRADILPGITRQIVLRLARKKFWVEERAVKISELAQASEAFLTATNKFVMPVVMVDKKKIGKGRVGERTKWLMKSFAEYVEHYR